MGVLPAHLCVCIMPCAYGGQNRTLDPLGLELQIVGSCHDSVGN